MKGHINIIWVLFIGQVGVMTSCEKATPPPDHFPNWGEVSILKNGESKNLRVWGETYMLDDIRHCFVYMNSKVNYTIRNEEWIQFDILQPEVKINDTLCIGYSNIFFPEPLSCVGTYYTSMIGGDVIGDSYKVIPEEYNYMVVTEWDLENLTISGEFQVSYYFTGDEHVHEWMADTIRFTEGHFTTRLDDLDIK